MNKIILLAALVFSTSVFADEIKFENYDCQFTAAEIQTSLETMVGACLIVAKANFSVKENSFLAQDSVVSGDGSWGGNLAKKITFQASSGENLELKTNNAFRPSGPELKDLIFTQGIQSTFSDLGALKSTECILKLSAPAQTAVINSDTNILLTNFTDILSKYFADGHTVLYSKPVPIN